VYGDALEMSAVPGFRPLFDGIAGSLFIEVQDVEQLDVLAAGRGEL
jgi:hypothetical protein